VWYVRVGKGRRIRIRAEYGTPDFEAEYQAAVTRKPHPKCGPASGSLEWLIGRYRETVAWSALSAATRRQRENIFRGVIATAGDTSFAKIERATIIAGRERRAATPAQARNFLDAMRGLFRWATKAEMTKSDPTLGVENPPRPKSDGLVAWTEDDVAAYDKRWPIGTHERVWRDVLLYTGLARGDAVRLGRQHVRNGIAAIKMEKERGGVTVTIPILDVLRRTLDAGPCGDLTYICGKGGRPLTKESFGNAFSAACEAADVPGSAHGLRKIAATTAAMNGATTEQLKALFGWTSDAMPSLYVKSANRARMAISAAHLLVNTERTSIPAPSRKVRAPGRKGK
jgi:site-specific recombinase XerD